VDVLWTYNTASTFKLIIKFVFADDTTPALTGVEASDKSLDLPVKRIQFRDETSDRDGLSIINTDFDYSRASFNSSNCRILTNFCTSVQ